MQFARGLQAIAHGCDAAQLRAPDVLHFAAHAAAQLSAHACAHFSMQASSHASPQAARIASQQAVMQASRQAVAQPSSVETFWTPLGHAAARPQDAACAQCALHVEPRFAAGAAHEPPAGQAWLH